MNTSDNSMTPRRLASRWYDRIYTAELRWLKPFWEEFDEPPITLVFQYVMMPLRRSIQLRILWRVVEQLQRVGKDSLD